MSTIEFIYIAIALLVGIYGIYVFGVAEYKKYKAYKETGNTDYADEVYFESINKNI